MQGGRPSTMSTTSRPTTMQTTVPLVFKEGHDLTGRIIVNNLVVDEDVLPEDVKKFTSSWQTARLCSQADWKFSSSSVWPEIDFIVVLQRFDIYVCYSPFCQQGTIDLAESRKIRYIAFLIKLLLLITTCIIRNTPGFIQWKTIFLLNKEIYMTKPFLIETAGPPRRCRVS